MSATKTVKRREFEKLCERVIKDLDGAAKVGLGEKRRAELLKEYELEIARKERERREGPELKRQARRERERANRARKAKERDEARLAALPRCPECGQHLKDSA